MFPRFPCLLFPLKECAIFGMLTTFWHLSLSSALKHMVSKIGGGMEETKKKSPVFLFFGCCLLQRVLLLLTGAAGGALGPSKHRLHFLNPSQVRIVPSCTSRLVWALSGSGQGLSALSEVFSTSEKERREEKVLYVGFWQEMKKRSVQTKGTGWQVHT